MSKGYTNKETVENYTLTTIDPSFDDQLDDFISDVEAYIENITGRVFIADSTATVRKYDGDNSSDLIIDDCVAVEEVVVGDDTDPLHYFDSGYDDDFYVYPANILPKTRLKRAGGHWGRGNQNISVKAKWGYSTEVPGDIRNAATNLVAGIINTAWNIGEGEDTSGQIQSMSIGRYSVSYKQGSTQSKDFSKLSSVFDHYKKFML